METWKPVVGWEDKCEISDQGRVRTLTGRIRRPSLNTSGYPSITLYRDGKKQTFTVHKLVMATFLGPRPAKKEVNHKDGNRANAVLSNLEYVTRSENNMHAYRVLGRNLTPCYGSKNGFSKLKEGQVLEIIRHLQGGETQATIAVRFGVRRAAISAIKRGENWSHLTGIIR